VTDTARDRYRDLQRLARTEGRPSDELMTLYALEGFLARLVTTTYRDTFVLKGGMLLAAHDTRRPTRDIDVQALNFKNDVGHVLQVVREWKRIPATLPSGPGASRMDSGVRSPYNSARLGRSSGIHTRSSMVTSPSGISAQRPSTEHATDRPAYLPVVALRGPQPVDG
jgi:hypothetical protein